MEFQVITALNAVVSILLQLGLLGVALAVVRKVHAQAAYVIAAAAGIRVLATCCVDGGTLGLELADQFEVLRSVSPFFRIVGGLEVAFHWGALTFAAVLLARSVAARGAQGEVVHGS